MAQFSLGWMYSKGIGVVQNSKKELLWFQKAAEQGHGVAQHSVGLMYFNGKGIKQDVLKAHMWWNLSAANGNEDSRKYRDALEKAMPPSQVSKAQKLAREWMAKH